MRRPRPPPACVTVCGAQQSHTGRSPEAWRLRCCCLLLFTLSWPPSSRAASWQRSGVSTASSAAGGFSQTVGQRSVFSAVPRVPIVSLLPGPQLIVNTAHCQPSVIVFDTALLGYQATAFILSVCCNSCKLSLIRASRRRFDRAEQVPRQRHYCPK